MIVWGIVFLQYKVSGNFTQEQTWGQLWLRRSAGQAPNMLLSSWRLLKMQVQKDFLGCPAHVMPLHISVLVIDDYIPKLWYTVHPSLCYLTTSACTQLGTESNLPRDSDNMTFLKPVWKNPHCMWPWIGIYKYLESGKTKHVPAWEKWHWENMY